MDTEQCTQLAMVQNSFTGEDTSSFEKLKCISAPASDSNCHEGVDCNICLEFVQDPVVTLCGHLFCWPCIYKWLHFQTNPTQVQQKQKCPVCKCAVSHTTLIPLYGLGKPAKGESHHAGLVIPQRPSGPTCNTRAQLITTSSGEHRQVSQPHVQSQSHYSHLGSHSNDTAMVGLEEIMYARMFASSLEDLYTNQNVYHIARGSNPRLRSVAQANKSLSRIYLFLCYCVVACLILF